MASSHRRTPLWRTITQRGVRSHAVAVLSPALELLPDVALVEEGFDVQAYIDPASAQGSLLMRRIGCSHISGLLLGHFGPLVPMESAHFHLIIRVAS